MPISSALAWKSYFTHFKHLDGSNLVIDKIKESVSSSTLFIDSFDLISKNDGIDFISLDPSESKIQLFHNGTTLGDTWTDPDKQIITIFHSDDDPKPIQVLPKFIKDLKLKSHSVEECGLALTDPDGFNSLKNPKSDFIYKNLIPIPNLLTKTYLESTEKDPISIGSAFF